MATKKRTWEQKDGVKKVTPVKVCNNCEKKKIEISQEALEDGRITRNELVKEVSDLRAQLKSAKNENYDLKLKWREQDDIINDMFDDLVDYSADLENARMIRNVSIAINIILIILLIFVW